MSAICTYAKLPMQARERAIARMFRHMENFNMKSVGVANIDYGIICDSI